MTPGTGIQTWILQRVTAVFLLLYIIILSWFCLCNDVNYAIWQSFIMSPFMKVMTLGAVLSLSLHAWLGIWTVLTDYVHQVFLRHLLQMLVLFTLIGCFFWGLLTLYGVK